MQIFEAETHNLPGSARLAENSLLSVTPSLDRISKRPAWCSTKYSKSGCRSCTRIGLLLAFEASKRRACKTCAA